MSESTRSSLGARLRARPVFARDAISLSMGCVLLLGLALRVRFALSTGQVFDEFNTIFAGQVITERGVPLLPSGYWYIHGLTFSYLEAPFVLLARLMPSATEFIWRVPGIIVSMLGLWALYRVGGELFGRGAGLVAAMLLALLPEAIDWGTRARMYSLLQLLSLLTAYCFYRATEGGRSRYRWLWPVCFTAAMLTHLEAALLIPALVMGTLALGRWRWLLRRDTLIAFACAAAGAALPLVLERLGTAQLAGTSAGLSGIHGGLGRYIGFDPTELRYYGWYLFEPPRLYLSLAFFAVLALLFHADCRRSRKSEAAPAPSLPRQPLRFVCTVYAACLFEFAFAVAWHARSRYLHFLLPLLILPAAWALWAAGVSLVRALSTARARTGAVLSQPSARRQRLRGLTLALAIVGPLLATAPLGSWAIPKADAANPDYGAAFRWVRERWQEGDLILSPSVASVLYLGKLDYYLLESAGGALVQVNGQWLNSNSGAPHLRKPEELARVLDSDARVWVVFDDDRFVTDLAEGSQALLRDTMSVAWADRGMHVLVNRRPYHQVAALLDERADPTRDVVITSRPSQFENVYNGPLPVYTLDPASSEQQTLALLQSAASGGGRVWYLRWKDPSASARLAWVDYQLQTHAYMRAQQTYTDADLFTYVLADAPPLAKAPDAVLTPGWEVADALRLDQATLPSLRAAWGRKVGIELDWTVLAETDRYLSQTVHVVDDQGRRWGQADVWMVDERGKPTVDWEPGQRVHQSLAIELCPGLSPGTYHLMYAARDRVASTIAPIRDAEGHEQETIELGQLEVTAPPFAPVLGQDICPTVTLDRALTDALTLAGAVDVPSSASFGQPLTVGLVWRAAQAPPEDYDLCLRLVDADGASLGETRAALALESHPTSLWREGEIVWRYYTLQVPAEARAGTGALHLTLLNAAGQPVSDPITLAEIEIDGHRTDVPADAQRQEALVGDSIRILGYALTQEPVAPGDDVALTLFWQATQPVAGSYKVFTHLLDAAGQVVGQQDSLPRAGQYPTSAWMTGEVVVDRYSIEVPSDAPAGEYALEVGMYAPEEGGARLPLTGADGTRLPDDRLLLDTTVRVE